MLLPGALVLSVISAITGIAPFIFIWMIVSELFGGGAGSSRTIAFCAWWAVGTSAASILFYFLALTFSHLAAFRVEANIRKFAMRKIIRLPLGYFDKNTSGRIRKVVDENASITHSFLAHQLPDLAGTVIIPLAVIALIFIFDWRLGLACVAPIVISMTLFGAMMNTEGKRFMNNYMTSLEEMNTEAVEYVRGIPVVKVFQRTVFSFKNFYNSIIKYKEMVFRYTCLWEKPMSAYTVFINGFSFFLVPAAILLINNSGNHRGVIVNLFLYVLITPFFSQSIMRSMHLRQAMAQASEAVRRLEEITDSALLPAPLEARSPNGFAVSFRDVSFGYPGSESKAISGITFDVPEGKTVALVGASGSGKTTIARMVPRFWDVDAGKVLIGGVNVRDMNPEKLMRNISFVFQNTHLFKTTLLENIKLGNPSASIEQIEQALDMAQCRDIINGLRDGLNTKIGVEGTYLSGGEQQRIVLARAFLKNAPVVILDEATAFADPENEHMIQKALRKLMKGKTVLMIAHRLTSVVDADEILVIDGGIIVERGTHEELINKKGVYSRMWEDYQKSIKWSIGKEALYV